MNIFSLNLQARKESNLEFRSIGDAISASTISLTIENLPYSSGQYQWLVKADKNDTDINAISASYGTLTNSSITHKITLSSPTYVIGNRYYYALRVFNEAGESQEVIQVSFTISKNIVLGSNTNVLNFLPWYLPQFTVSERDALTTTTRPMLIYNTTTSTIEKYEPGKGWTALDNEAANSTIGKIKAGLYYGATANPTGSAITSQVSQFEGWTGVKFDTISIYEGLNTTSAANYENDVVPVLRNTDKNVMYVLEPFGGSLDTIIASLQSQSGSFYNNLRNVFEKMVSNGNSNRVYLAMFHECNGAGPTYPWQWWYSATSNTPAKGIQAYQLCVTLARSMGVKAKFVQWFLEFNSSAGGNTPYADQYAGDDYIDIVGITTYNRYNAATSPSTAWKSALSTAKPAIDQINAMSKNPIWICECGSTPGGQLEAISITTAGSGGTNGTYTLTFSYPNGTPTGCTLPTGTITVSGGAITATTISTRGKRNTENLQVSYTVPGLTGSALTLRLTPSTRSKWLEDLYNTVKNRDYSRIEQVTLFADYVNSNEWGQFTDQEFKIISEGVKSFRSRVEGKDQPANGDNLLAEYYPTATTAFTVSGTGTTMTLSDDVPEHFPVGTKSIKVYRPSGSGSSAANNEFYQLINPATSVWEPGKTYTVSAWIKSENPGYQVSLGSRENGGSNTRLVQENIPLTTGWKQYRYTYSNGLSMSNGIKLFDLLLGINTTAGNVWVTGFKVEKGDRATPPSFRNRANHIGTQLASTISDFASTVRGTVLTGVSFATSTTVTAFDTVLTAIGKLQAQITVNTTALASKADLVGGKVPTSQLPTYIDSVQEVANEAALPATGVSGVIYVTTDDNKQYRWTGSTYINISSSLDLGETSSTAYRGDRGKTAYDHSQITAANPHGVTKGDVGLGNVDNTSDANKPVSTAQQTALNAKENTIAAGTTTQYWRGDKSWQELDKDAVGLDLVDNTADIDKPVSTATQTALDLKVDKVTGKGLSTEDFTTTEKLKLSSFDEVFTSALKTTYDSTATWVTTNGANTLTHISDTNNPHNTTKSQIGLGNVDNTSDSTKNSATATLTNKTISGASNTLSNIPQSAVTSLVSDLATKATKNTLDILNVERFTDFFASAEGGFAGANNSGAGAANNFNTISVTTSEIGILQNVTGTTTTGRANFRYNAQQILFGGGVHVFETKVRIPVLSDNTDTFKVFVGFSDVDGDDAVDGAYFRYTNGTNSGKWQCVTRSNTSNETVNDSGVAPVAATWTKLKVIVNSNATQALFYIDGTLVATITTNIPSGTGRNTGIQGCIVKTLGTTSRTLEADYAYYNYQATSR